MDGRKLNQLSRSINNTPRGFCKSHHRMSGQDTHSKKALRRRTAKQNSTNKIVLTRKVVLWKRYQQLPEHRRPKDIVLERKKKENTRVRSTVINKNESKSIHTILRVISIPPQHPGLIITLSNHYTHQQS
jgi:hypothetical protein